MSSIGDDADGVDSRRYLATLPGAVISGKHIAPPAPSLIFQKAMLFFGKVRIDREQLAELGRKLQTGELETGFIKQTFCLKDDPAVGLNIWEADDLEDLKQKIAPHSIYYADLSEITPLITPHEAQHVLMGL